MLYYILSNGTLVNDCEVFMMKCSECKHSKVLAKGHSVVAFCELNMNTMKIKDKDCFERREYEADTC